MARNADYWRGRARILEEAAHRSAQQTVQGFEAIYREAEMSVAAEIEKWYGRFAENNGITLSEARKILNAGQLEEFHWTVNQYIKAAEQADLSPEWIKKLENASARFHVSRLESVQVGIQQQIELLYGNQTDSIDRLLRNVAGNGYTHTAYDIQKGLGLGWDIAALNQKKLDTLLSKPWTTDQRTFRDRCWLQKADLVESVNRNLVQGMLRGDKPDKIINRIKDRFNVQRSKAARLVYTETTFFNSAANKQAYEELDVKMVEIIETLDSHTCDICAPLDGKTIPLSSYEPGVTVPPFHPNCRGTTAPYIGDLAGERAARSEGGEVYNVPANMSYTDWKKTFVDGGPKNGLTKTTGGSKIDDRRKTAIEKIRKKKLWQGLSDRKRDIIVDALQNGDPDFLEMAEQSMDKCSVNWELDQSGTAHYTFRTGRITMTKRDGDTDLAQTFWHEYGHFMDDCATSNAPVKLVTTHTIREGQVEQWTYNGASRVSEKLGYQNAMMKDINNLLDDLGLSDKYYVKPGKDEYTNPWLYNKLTGDPVDPKSFSLETDDLCKALSDKFNDISGLTKARNYAYEQGYPVMPKRSDYFETYKTPKRGLIRERPIYKGADTAYREAMLSFCDKRDEFENTHDVTAIFRKQEELVERAIAVRNKLGCVSDTVDGGVYGAFRMIVATGGHKAEYYMMNNNNVKEGVANVFMGCMTGDSDVFSAFEQICPEMFNVMKEAWLTHG